MATQSGPSQADVVHSQTEEDLDCFAAATRLPQQELEEQGLSAAVGSNTVGSANDEAAWAAISFGQSRHSVPSAQMQLGRTPPAITVRNMSPHVMTMRGSC